MNLAKFPRRGYVTEPTPLEALPNFSKALGADINIYIKRDDLLPGTAGGNKTRKLDFSMADAINQGADTIITCGAVQSNHCRLTLAAAVKEGLKCHLVLEQRVPNSYREDASGNNYLFHLLGVEGIHVVDGGSDMMAEMNKVADELKAKGRKPYIIPGGGSNAIGGTGYAACAQEILQQSFAMGVSFDHIICTSGSTGTHAGLLVGLKGENANIPLTGIGINRKKDAQRKAVYDHSVELAKHLGVANEITMDDVIVFDDYIGEGYSRVTKGMVKAVKLVARTEAILLDPVYTGKTMDGMLDLMQKGYFDGCKNILFVHTGGSPALFAYTDTFFPEE